MTALLPEPARPELLASVRMAAPIDRPSELSQLYAVLAGARARSFLASAPLPYSVRHALRRAVELEGGWLKSIDPGEPDKEARAVLGLGPGATGPARMVAVIGSYHDLPAGQLSAGQAGQRVALTAARYGLSAAILPAALTMPEVRTALARSLGRSLHPQMMLHIAAPAPAANVRPNGRAKSSRPGRNGMEPVTESALNASPGGDLLETAAAHASTNVPLATTRSTVGEVLEGMRGRDFDTAALLAVVDGDILRGLVPLERALAAPPATPVAEVMDPRPPSVAPGVDQEHAAWRAVRDGVAALAVVDADGRFRGVIPPSQLLTVLLAEHDEDMARLGGYLNSTEAASTAATEGVARRLWHRLPWLLLGLAGALLAAVIVGSFEQQLERQVVLAFFLPGVVYLADAVGTQTEAVVIRGLSVGVSIARVALREAITGVLLGGFFAAVSYPVVLLIWAEPPVAVTVAVALFAASSIATVIAMVLPWVLQRVGRDPAFGSGPLATVVQDLLSIAIYFATATAVIP